MEQLVRNDALFATLMSGLINNARLGYDKKSLMFSDSFINEFLLAINAPLYDARLEQLIAEDEDK